MDSKGLTIEEPAFGIKIFAIGDIHGCFTALERLLSKLPLNWGKDFLIFLGDYIDRGPNPRKVLELVMGLKRDYPTQVFALKGNHEWLFERYLIGLDKEVFLYNGGAATLRDFYVNGELLIPVSILDFVKSLPLYIEIGPYLFVHAGINPKKPLTLQSEEDLLWIRQSFYAYEGKLPKVVIFGHTPFHEVFIREDRIGLDTGCVYGGKLSALMLPEREVYQVECRR